MLAETSSSTVTRRPAAGSARSSTGWASSQASVTRAAPRRIASSRRMPRGSGGVPNAYAHTASATSTSDSRASAIHGALGAKCSERSFTSRRS